MTRTPSPLSAIPLLRLDPESDASLQEQIRQRLIEAILSGVLVPGRRLPSSRALGLQLSVARNTVVLACQQLVADGYLVARERSGLYVNGEISKGRRLLERVGGPTQSGAVTGFQHRLKTAMDNRDRHRFSPDWQKYPFPFLEGRFDRSLFPVAEWREANRLALREGGIHHWATDSGDA